MSNGNYFERIKLGPWQQFDSVDLDLDSRVSIITGANGSGKTTILSILAKHCSWNMSALALPKKKSKSTASYLWATGSSKKEIQEEDNQRVSIGDLYYGNVKNISFSIVRYPISGGAEFSPDILDQQHVDCLFIPSHRSLFRYQKLMNLPTDTSALTKMNGFERVAQAGRERYTGNSSQHKANYHIKEMLIAWSTFGYGNPSSTGMPELIQHYKGFEAILSILLPEALGFKRLRIENFEVVIECSSGDFIIDAASGGITAIIDLAWQIYMFSEGKDKSFTVIIDEIENHLHPSMQRAILGDLAKAFSDVRFIVTTHSPLIINSVKDAKVYALRYNSKHKVYSEYLDFKENATTASDILSEVLGVPTTMPIWAEDKLNNITSNFIHSKAPETEERSRQLSKELDEAGLSAFTPQALERIIEGT